MWYDGFIAEAPKCWVTSLRLSRVGIIPQTIYLQATWHVTLM
jgi:hypothetical protein